MTESASQADSVVQGDCSLILRGVLGVCESTNNNRDMVVTDYKAQGGLGHVPASLSLYHVIDRSPCFVPQIMAWFALVVGARAALRPRIIHSLHSKKVERRAVLSWSLLHLCRCPLRGSPILLLLSAAWQTITL
jgi:hypothetical protein